MHEDERKARLALSLIKGVGHKRYMAILNEFKSGVKFWKSSNQDILSVFGQKVGSKILKECDEIDIDKFIANLVDKNIRYVLLGEKEYPYNLSQISDPPICLYYQGSCDFTKTEKLITVVGTRNNTKYGERILKKFIPYFVEKDFVIVSGLALGIDKLAHSVCLENGGTTFAVIGSHLLEPTPFSNKNLFEKIKNNGLAISEYHENSQIVAANFPRRNRILAGLSKSTLVIEAGDRSGALITAHLAFDYNREVFAVPGSLEMPQSSGCNKLIKIQKAKLVESPEEVLVELGYKLDENTERKFYDLTSEENLIKICLEKEPKTLDNIKVDIDMETSKLLASLMTLEMKGLVYRNDKDEYTLVL